MTRRALLSALGAVALAASGCSDDGGGGCPGELVGTFTLRGALVDAETACTVEPPGGFAAVARATAPELAPFRAKLVLDPTDGPSRAAALCTGARLASPYYGARGPDGTFTLEADSGAAVLSPDCGPSCSASVREQISGAPTGTSPDGSATGFAGRLVETFEYRGGDCSACLRAASGADLGAPLHCVATYALSSVP